MFRAESQPRPSRQQELPLLSVPSERCMRRRFELRAESHKGCDGLALQLRDKLNKTCGFGLHIDPPCRGSKATPDPAEDKTYPFSLDQIYAAWRCKSRPHARWGLLKVLLLVVFVAALLLSSRSSALFAEALIVMLLLKVPCPVEARQPRFSPRLVCSG